MSKDYQTIFAKRLLNHTFESVQQSFNEDPPAQGDLLILSMQQHNTNRYRLVSVVNPASGKQRRIIIDRGDAFGGASYYRNGKSCFAPKGQTRLLPFNAAVAGVLSQDKDTHLSDQELDSLLPDIDRQS